LYFLLILSFFLLNIFFSLNYSSFYFIF